MTKIFLTGSTSYLGSKFIELYGNKYEIFGVARGDSNHPLDLTNFSEVTKSFSECKPDVIIHVAADLGRDIATADTILKVNPAITEHLVGLAKAQLIPFIFTSTEAVYGGKESEGNYKESDELKPRSLYGESKIMSEKIIQDSGLPYLIVRGHRFVGINKSYHRPKQFPDALNALRNGEVIHTDSTKLFTPTLINNICDIFSYYIENGQKKQALINIGIDQPTTYYSFMRDVAEKLGIDGDLVRPDGDEANWPQNSTLSFDKATSLGYPWVSYADALSIIANDYQ